MNFLLHGIEDDAAWMLVYGVDVHRYNRRLSAVNETRCIGLQWQER